MALSVGGVRREKEKREIYRPCAVYLPLSSGAQPPSYFANHRVSSGLDKV